MTDKTEAFKTVHSLYNELLRRDVREYEEKTKRDRLQRLDISIQDYFRDELTEMKEADQARYQEMLLAFAALDDYLADNGIPEVRGYERLQKANAFFTANPDKLPGQYEHYCKARKEAWAGLSG
jgi:hypothetical protein